MVPCQADAQLHPETNRKDCGIAVCGRQHRAPAGAQRQLLGRVLGHGSFAIPIQHDEPQDPDKVNWLPAPQIGFAMTIKAVWSCARGSGTMRIVRLLEGWGLGAALAHGGSARRSRLQSGGCLRWCSQSGGRVAQGELRRGVPIAPAMRRVTDVIAISWDGSISRSP